MSKQIELALLSLMPAHGPELPTSLVELTGSLLAQSRHRASTLKAEEEVARHYACANIACDRLKISLNLPPIEPRPPVPPRIYKRLYTHLDNILPNSSTTPRSSRIRTPRSSRQDIAESPASSARQLPSRCTPSKETSLSQFRTSKASQATPIKATTALGLHAWIQPVVRYLCTETGNRKLAPTVLAGIESIVAPGGQRTEDVWVCKHIVELVATIYLFVMMRVRAVTSGGAIDRESYVPMRKEIISCLTRARGDVIRNGSTNVDVWDGWKDVKTREFDAAVAHINGTDWLAGDWYKGIDDIVSSTREVEFPDEPVEDLSGSASARRADSMLQEKYDFLSDARRADYDSWKEKMLFKIRQASMASGFAQVDP
ncbi:hypothetical protein RJ55_03955 [Drechmeria coniospora]|nr:hypothetical protein RJ55_03955 [Drechmeria coniospora]